MTKRCQSMMVPYLKLVTTACCVSLFLPLAVVSLTITAGGFWSLTSIKLAVLGFGISPALLCIATRRTSQRFRSELASISRQQARYLDRVETRYVDFLLVLAAALSLFAELCMIRWQSCVFPLFALYKNFSLLACFAGLGLGYALADRKHIPLILTPLLFTWQMLVLIVTRATLPVWCQQVLKTTPVVEQLDMGLKKLDGLWANLPSYALLAIVFILTALAFIPIGQVCGRLMARRKKLRAYGANLAGSLFGVVFTFVLSWLWTPPIVWFGCVAAMLSVFFTFRVWVLLIGSLSTVAMAVVLSWPIDPYVNNIYSPYQRLECTTGDDGRLQVLAAGHYFQRVHDLSRENANRRAKRRIAEIANYYEFPYRVAGSAERVAIVGAGTGNDVAAALRMGARHVDAIEIDPAIVHLGREHHPEKPYGDERVQVIVNDARTHFRTTSSRYDMVVYGLLDSHSLLSHASNVRLDSFVYTIQGFEEAFACLNDGGALIVSFCTIKPEIGRKIYLMMTEASGGTPPTCVEAKYDQSVVFILRKGERVALSQKLVRDTGFEDVTSLYADPRLRADPSTDDWPFFYMPQRVYPLSYLPMALLIVACSLLITVPLLRPKGVAFPNVDFFFLGAGFMLVETKAITELGLTFGNTWHVIGIAIIGILTMAFLANAVVARFGFQRVGLSYLLLAVCLGIGFLVARNGGLPSTTVGRIATAVLLTSPMFFSGIIFSTLLRQGGNISGIMAANLIGSMLGGLLEYNSMYFGFANLYLFAMALFGIAFAGSFLRHIGVGVPEAVHEESQVSQATVNTA
jgi:hypothetical protein